MRTVLVYDLSGSFTHIAEAMIGQAEVLYFVPWQSGFPTVKDFLPGVGVPGIERVDDFFDALPRADFCVFPDVGMPGLQQYLRGQGIPVCGAAHGSAIEQDRYLLKMACKEAGLGYSPAEVVQGVDELRALLQQADECFIKASYWRGDIETYHHRNWRGSEPWLNSLALKLGPAGHEISFLVEDPIEGKPCIEVGADTFFANGKFPKKQLWGYEIKDASFLGFTAPLPEPLAELQEKLAVILSAYDYRGPVSTEYRMTPKGAYLIDVCSRFGSPPSEIQAKMITNLADVLEGYANGEIVEPEFRAEFGAEFILSSPWVEEHTLGIEVDDLDHVALHGHCRFDGQEYVVSPPNLSEFGAAVGWGDSIEEAIESAKEAAKGVKGYQVSFQEAALGDAQACVEEGEKLGITI